MTNPDTPLERVRRFNAACLKFQEHIGVTKFTSTRLMPDGSDVELSAQDLREVLRERDTFCTIAHDAYTAVGLKTRPLADVAAAIEGLKSSNANRGLTLTAIAVALGYADGIPLEDMVPAVQELKNFSTNVAGVFGLPVNFELGDAFTYVHRSKSERHELAAALRDIRDTLGLSSAAKPSDTAAGVKSLQRLLKNVRDNCEAAYRVMAETRAALSVEEGEDLPATAKERMAALQRERTARRQAQAELADLKGHCVRIEAENQRYRGSTLDAKASHERRARTDGLSADRVPMPANADQAAGMALAGEAWLRQHAPERLRAAPTDCMSDAQVISGQCPQAVQAQPKRMTAPPPLYAVMYPELARIAKAHGYALSVHGSMTRDFDLIAVPWTDHAGDPYPMVDEMKHAVRGVYTHHEFDEPCDRRPRLAAAARAAVLGDPPDHQGLRRPLHRPERDAARPACFEPLKPEDQP